MLVSPVTKSLQRLSNMKITAHLFIFTLFGIPLAAAQSTPDPLFADTATLAVTLTAPLRQMSRDRSDEPEYLPGTFSYVDSAGAERSFDIRVRPRGKSRREREVCRFPPLRLNFEKKQVRDTLFDHQNVLKLVTHCRSSKSFQDFVLREYLAYRMLNLLTDVSFKVRLLKVTYLDSQRNSKPYERYGFFIEHKKRLADRLGLAVAEPVSISTDQLAPEQASIAELFQFLISNTDFSFIAAPPGEICCHNAILLRDDTPPAMPGDDFAATVTGAFLPVPYDFDRSGMVDPPNALPDENLGQKSVRDRLYRGFCRGGQYQAQAIEKTVTMRSEFEALINDQVDLGNGDRKEMLRFLEAYYRILERPSMRERMLKCRPPL